MTDTSPSLQNRLSKRRAELQEDHPIDLEVPGFEDILVARYHPLDFQRSYKIENRHAKNKNEAERVLLTACDKLINACDGLYEKQEDGSLRDLEYKWSAAAARDLFGLDIEETVTARQALLAIFPGPLQMALLEHTRQYVEESNELQPQINEDLEGESEPPVAA